MQATPVVTEERPELGQEEAEPEVTEADLLVEEVSIDGMCGVY